MNQQDLAAEWGTSERCTVDRNGHPQFWYGDLSVNAHLENDELVEVGFGPKAKVSIRGLSPFQNSGAFAKLCAIDGDPKETLGFIVLLNLGITLTGFHDDDESQLAITAFRRGRWDAVLPSMKDFA